MLNLRFEAFARVWKGLILLGETSFSILKVDVPRVGIVLPAP